MAASQVWSTWASRSHVIKAPGIARLSHLDSSHPVSSHFCLCLIFVSLTLNYAHTFTLWTRSTLEVISLVVNFITINVFNLQSSTVSVPIFVMD